MSSITGNKETDRLVLLKIDNERDFSAACMTNRYYLSLCDNNLLRRRIQKYYPQSLKHKEDSESFKMFYSRLIQHILLLKQDYNIFFKVEDPIDYYNILHSRMFYLWKIRQAIRKGYTDLAIFLVESRNIYHTTLPKLLKLSQEHNNQDLVTYFTNKMSF